MDIGVIVVNKKQIPFEIFTRLIVFFWGGGCFCYDHNSRRYNWKNLGVMKNPEFAFPLLKIKCYVGHHLDAKVVSKYITSKVISEVMK